MSHNPELTLETQKAIVKSTVQHYWTLAQERWAGLRDKPCPEILFDLKGRAAGQAQYSWGWSTQKLRFNVVLMSQNWEDFRVRTVAHEVAHVVVFYLRPGKRVRPHGKEWEFVMTFFGVEPKRCHNYDVTDSAVGRQWIYKCNCRTHHLSTRRHNTIHNTGRKYFCKTCKTSLSFVKELGNG